MLIQESLKSCSLKLIVRIDNILGDNCSQNFHLVRYIVRYTVGNLVLRLCAS